MARAIKGANPAELEVTSRDERPYVLRARPYPAGSSRVEGVIITLVSGRKAAQDGAQTADRKQARRLPARGRASPGTRTARAARK